MARQTLQPDTTRQASAQAGALPVSGQIWNNLCGLARSKTLWGVLLLAVLWGYGYAMNTPAVDMDDLAIATYQQGGEFLRQGRITVWLLQALPKPGTLWNVNFPDCAASACKGILRGRVPAACSFYDNEYDRAEGALSIRVSNPGPEQCREGSDIHAILHGYVSIGEVRSPLF